MFPRAKWEHLVGDPKLDSVTIEERGCNLEAE